MTKSDVDTTIAHIRATYYPDPIQQAHKMSLIERLRRALKRGSK